MEVVAPRILGNKFELFNSCAHLPHLDVLCGDRSHTFAESGIIMQVLELAVLSPLAASAQTNSR